MELDDLKKVIRLLRDTDIAELQIEKEGIKIKIRRDKFFSAASGPQQPVLVEKKGVKVEEAEEGLLTVASPMIGTFYRSSSPDVEAFVDVGTEVKKGDTLCVIEAMKLMNTIESEIDGVIIKIFLENGHPVEYGEPIFLVRPK
ncbi:acetyl-CoA carboxylase biotin carboxyl carrier protein [Thermodesulfovibrionales bacterium]|nr:acetyl-CoA carboxylase biotin carboxyl carrier protein [Thermodesulfovibrionales bacterium]MCL0033529.1 acetyl-CoA carboxylase biotin carboxyl carrier protein [Thermodesulfovibrionales bacterium]MCL0034082.1 acetyl-CoA carboxylase biotin carboxyl carrier protein [Thermodesulfovibrionales bacterium]MCL0040171.1 acetyl-CoA carboxylase biotin carboxyl carrier protein [Thermodesulfovibrionales bacterium]MCL0040656.1 acetyl-CoA carboxylase biotin carboxyl carrier protein [Thermodesulfovibrionales